MKHFYTLTLTLFLFLCLNQLKAQDPRFSQINAAPHQLNPAMIGVYEGQFRFIANYRELYASILADNPYRTISASFDMRYRVMQGDYVGFGVSAMRDDVGIAAFNRFQGQLGASYMKQLGGTRYGTNDQYLVAGAQLGIGQRGFDFVNLWFSDQFDVGNATINFDTPSLENFERQQSDTYLDINAGILWYALFDDRKSIYFGGALHHINSPNISFLQEEDEVLHTRWVGHAGGEVPLSNTLSFLPGIAVMGQNQAFSTTAGGNFRYTNRDWREVALRAGLWAHFSNALDSGVSLDAIIVSATLEMERWKLGVSYDITSSTLAEANNARGAFEVSLIYIHPENRRRAMRCPNL